MQINHEHHATRGARAARPTDYLFVLLLTLSATSRAGDLELRVVDRSGHPVAGVVATVSPASGHTPVRVRASATAVMDQQHLSFVPRVLVVGVGTSVEFPNSDSVSHQVYSFSPAKSFQLPLYKGTPHRPVTFDQEGLVVLGCNIHDQMAGYILVTRAPYFGTTDVEGVVRVADLPSGDYEISFWSPFIADPPAALTRTVHVAGRESTANLLQLSRDLRATPEPRPRRDDWDY